MFSKLKKIFKGNNSKSQSNINEISYIDKKIQGFEKMGNIEAICPYCGSSLEKKPQRKKKCSNCENHIFVRTRPQDREKILLKENEIKNLENQWEKISSIKNWIVKLKNFGITEKEIDTKEKELEEKFNTKPQINDIIRGLFNDLLQKNIEDFQTLKMVYYNMALFLNEEKRDFSKVLEESNKYELLSYKSSGVIHKVEIRGAGNESCENCQKLQGQIFNIDEALEKNILPCKECTFKLYDENRGFCRCMYIAHTE